jgi:tellurite resistance protein
MSAGLPEGSGPLLAPIGGPGAATLAGAGAPLRHLGPQWFAVVMGWCGLALAWHRAEPIFGGLAHTLASAAAAVGLLVFAALIVASLLRWQRHPASVAEDIRHPVWHAFFAAVPISLMLFGTLGVALGFDHDLARAPWALGVVLQFAATVWVLGRWPTGASSWPAKSPVLFIPVVGNVLVPLAGMPLGHPNVSWAFLAIGTFFWPIVVALVLARQSQQPMPERLLPSWFILVAPPAVVGLIAPAMGFGQGGVFAMVGLATFSLALALRIAPKLPKLPFGMPFWAMSFPLAAFAALMLRTAVAEPSLQLPAILLLSAASLVVLWLSLATVRGLRNGSLLQPEPVAAIVPTAAVKGA